MTARRWVVVDRPAMARYPKFWNGAANPEHDVHAMVDDPRVARFDTKADAQRAWRRAHGRIQSWRTQVMLLADAERLSDELALKRQAASRG